MSVQLELGFEVRSHPNYDGAFAIYRNNKRYLQPGVCFYYETQQGAVNSANKIIERIKNAELQRQADLLSFTVQPPRPDSEGV